MKPELLIRSGCVNAEGPVWDEDTGTLYFVDIEAGKIFSWANDRLTSWDAGEQIGCAVLREKGGMIAALKSGFYEVDFPWGGKRLIQDPERDIPGNRFNDGKVDPAGRLLAGTMALSSKENDPPTGALYCLDTDGSVSKRADHVFLSNGLAWSKDGHALYYIDTTARTVTRYDYDPATGSMQHPSVIIRVPEDLGYPDGCTIDSEGMLWIALWGGGAVSRWNPATGELLDRYDVPALNVSSCCFGGEDMEDLYITTASQETDLEKYPLAGSIFVMKTGIAGAASLKYRG